MAFCFGSSVPVSDQPEDVKAARIATCGKIRRTRGSLLVAGSRHFRTLSGERHGSLWRELPGGVTESGRPETDLGTVGFSGNQCLPERTSGIGWSGGYREAKNPCGAPVTAMKWQVTPESLYYVPKSAGKIQTSHRNYGERTVLSRLGIPGR